MTAYDVRTPAVALRPRRRNRTARRVASSIYVPWAFGLVGLLVLAAVAAFAGGRVGSGPVVPTAVLDAQQAITTGAAQQVRSGLNASLDDLEQLSDGLALVQRRSDLGPWLQQFSQRHRRYRAVYLVTSGRDVLATGGGSPHPRALPDDLSDPGMGPAVELDEMPVVVQYVPLTLHDRTRGVLVGEYDVSNLRRVLGTLSPSAAWVVTSQGQVVAATGGFYPFQHLASRDLRRAATLAHKGTGVETTGGNASAEEVLAYAPAHGEGAASRLGWGVVSARDVNTIAVPQTQIRHQAECFALILVALTLGTFGWLFAVVVRPLRRLAQEAQRLSGGEPTGPIQIRRFDEVGLIGHSLERMRVRTMRQGVR